MVHEGQEGFGGHGGRYRENQDFLPAPLADGKGIDKINGWMNSKILISPEEYEELEERERIGKYPSDQVESYFSLVENILTPRSNPLLAVRNCMWPSKAL